MDKPEITEMEKAARANPKVQAAVARAKAGDTSKLVRRDRKSRDKHRLT